MERWWQHCVPLGLAHPRGTSERCGRALEGHGVSLSTCGLTALSTVLDDWRRGGPELRFVVFGGDFNVQLPSWNGGITGGLCYKGQPKGKLRKEQADLVLQFAASQRIRFSSTFGPEDEVQYRAAEEGRGVMG